MKGLLRQNYTKEFKEEVVKLVTEQGLSIAEAARRLSMPSRNISRWLTKAKVGGVQETGRGREVSDKDAEMSRLRRDNAELRMERDILKKSDGVLYKGVAARYAFMRRERPLYPLRVLCSAMRVSRSGFTNGF